jgi:hypothetical protein
MWWTARRRTIMSAGCAAGAAVIGCGTSRDAAMDANPDAGVSSVDPRPEGSAGVDGGPRPDGGGPDAAIPDASEGGRSTCTGSTPGAIGCGQRPCAAATEACCGGPGGVCLAKAAFCGAGGVIRVRCDDSSDCADGEICCPSGVPSAGNDAPYETSCRKPDPFGGAFGCGKSIGGFDFPNLCACDADCAFGTCKLGTIFAGGSNYRRCQ